MEDIWQQFHRLPRVIRNAVASPAALATIDRLEQVNPGLDLAALIMRVMVKETPVADLAKHLISEEKIEASAAESIVRELTNSVFSEAAEYLGLPKNTPATEPPPSPAPASTNTPITALPPVIPDRTPSPIPPSMAAPTAPLGKNAPPPSLSIEDDAEIAAHAANLKNISVASAAGPTDFDTIAQNVLNQHRLAFSDELLSKRAITILKTSLKGIRSVDDTKAMLMRPPKVGGLGLDPDIAAAVMATIDSQAKNARTMGMTRPPEPPVPLPLPKVPPPEQQKPAAVPPLSRDFRTMKPDQVAANFTEATRPSRPIYRPADIPPPPTMPVTKPMAAPTVTNQPTVEKSTKTPTTLPVETQPAPSPATLRQRTNDRPSVADVTAPVSTLGPAEEMRSFTLMQFRRLGQGAAESARKVLDKFKHLQDESFVLWSEAVAGWRQSEVYQIYLDMGRQSLDQNLSIDQVIKQRAAAALPYLSEHEFNVLADMNRRLQI